MPIKTHIARLCATTALAALFIGAPLSATRDLSGKPHIIGAAAQAQAVEEEPDFNGPGPSDLPPGDPDTNGGVSVVPDFGDELDGPNDPIGTAPMEPDGSDEGTGPVVPVVAVAPDVAVVTPSQTGGGGGNAVPATPLKTQQASVTTAAPQTLAPPQEAVSAFAESLKCPVSCTRTVSGDGTLTVEAAMTLPDGSILSVVATLPSVISSEGSGSTEATVRYRINGRLVSEEGINRVKTRAQAEIQMENYVNRIDRELESFAAFVEKARSAAQNS